MKKYVVALDQGTTSSRAIAFDRNGTSVAGQNKEFPQIFPKPGWVEHNPYDIVNSQTDALRSLLRQSGIKAGEIDSIGITNQRETVVVWNRSTGEPVYNAIVWQCRRTAPLCEELIRNGYSQLIKEKTGLLPDAYFSATKIKWILDNVPGARGLAEKNNLAAGTVDSWLIYNMSKGAVHATDPGNASRTMLFNIRDGCWDEELCDLFGIPMNVLPKVVDSSGVVFNYMLDGASIPVAGIAGDQQAALFGQACFNKGDSKNTYGTGCFILMNTGGEPVYSGGGLLTTVAWRIKGMTEYALEGSVFNAGSAIQWLRDSMGFMETAAQSNEMAMSVDDTGGVYFVPAFTGLGTPYWDMYARGIITGLTRGTTREHIVRAGLEAIAFRSAEVLEVMKEDSGLEIKSLHADGGASENEFLMQFQADILGIDITRPLVRETTALGAAFLAGLASGFWKTRGELAGLIAADRIFRPCCQDKLRLEKLGGWKDAVRRATGK
ncbi:MAG: glycerol kinase GlpK [Clostridia bacterium]|nr:glycerol kinase GlpK [Clostridia bacterium]